MEHNNNNLFSVKLCEFEKESQRLHKINEETEDELWRRIKSEKYYFKEKIVMTKQIIKYLQEDIKDCDEITANYLKDYLEDYERILKSFRKKFKKLEKEKETFWQPPKQGEAGAGVRAGAGVQAGAGVRAEVRVADVRAGRGQAGLQRRDPAGHKKISSPPATVLHSASR